MSSFSFAGRTALVTGGSRGLGFILARRLLEEGARVAICGRDPDTLDDAYAQLGGRGDLMTVTCDLSDPDEVDAMVAAVVERFGPVEILINNAGVIAVGPESSMSLDDYEYVMGANFWSAVHTTRAVLPGMKARGAGRIVNITSIGGKISVPHLLPYNCAKFAAVGFSEGLRAELADTGISVTTVVPGLMRTGSHLNAEFGGEQEAEYRWFALGASAPYPVAIGADRAARLIVRAAKRGQAEYTYPLSAVVAARLSGLLPGVTTNALALVDRFLPQPPRQPAGTRPGAAVEADIDAPVLRAATILGRAAAEEYKQFPPSR